MTATNSVTVITITIVIVVVTVMVIIFIIKIVFIINTVLAGLPSRVGDVAVYVKDISQLSLLIPF